MRQASRIPWIKAAETPWGFRLDVRAVTQHMISTSADPQCAANAISFGRDDGSAFAADEPAFLRVICALIHFRVTRLCPMTRCFARARWSTNGPSSIISSGFFSSAAGCAGSMRSRSVSVRRRR